MHPNSRLRSVKLRESARVSLFQKNGFQLSLLLRRLQISSTLRNAHGDPPRALFIFCSFLRFRENKPLAFLRKFQHLTKTRPRKGHTPHFESFYLLRCSILVRSDLRKEKERA